jgi:hypothetical protein
LFILKPNHKIIYFYNFVKILVNIIIYLIVEKMGKTKQAKKFAEVKRLISRKDQRLK